MLVVLRIPYRGMAWTAEGRAAAALLRAMSFFLGIYAGNFIPWTMNHSAEKRVACKLENMVVQFGLDDLSSYLIVYKTTSPKLHCCREHHLSNLVIYLFLWDG